MKYPSDSNETDQAQLALARLAEAASQLRVELSFEHLERIHHYWRLLSDYNQYTNLVSRADAKTVMADHVLDSLTLVELMSSAKPGARLIDIGSGAGFPGLVLAIVIADLQVTLLEPVGKKARFLESVVETVDGLASRVEVRIDRAEDLARSGAFRASFDFATARAVGPLAMIAELALPFLKMGGCLLSQKTARQLEAEVQSSSDVIAAIGGAVVKTVRPDSEILGKEHAVLILEKVKETPDAYPRTWTTIKRDNQR